MESQGMTVRPEAGGGTQLARNGFGEQSLERRDSASTTMAARAQAEVQARCIMALQRPRVIEAVRLRVLDHCKRPRFASKARFKKPKGKIDGIQQYVEGPSIRFVEAALQEYGNVQVSSVITYEDDAKLHVCVTVADLERNITYPGESIVTKRKEVKYLKKGQRAYSSRVNSYGEPVHLVDATDDDVAERKGAAESKLVRNLGLRILPADIIEEAMDVCVATLEKADAEDPGAARKRLLDGFHGVGVSPQDLADYLGHDLARIVPAELSDLRDVFVAIRDGDTTWSEVIAARRPAPKEEKGPIDISAAAVKGAAGSKAKPAERKKAAAEAPPPTEASSRAPAATAAAAPPSAPPLAAEPEDDLEKEVKALKRGLDNIFEHPGSLPRLRERIEALPEGVDRATLLSLAKTAARSLSVEAAVADEFDQSAEE